MSLCAALERSRRAGADPLHDGSEGVANSDQIVGVHLIPPGGDGRSFMPPRGYTNQGFLPSSRNSLASLSAEGGSRARSSTLLSTNQNCRQVKIIARRTVPRSMGTWLGMVLVCYYYLIEKEVF
jgi:hypothetical protein